MARGDQFVNKFVDIYTQAQVKPSELYMEDPTVLGFNLWFYYAHLPTGLNKTPSPLFSEQPGTDSAILYLENIGEQDRANSLRDFKERLRLLVYDTPYYFQTFDGLAGINKFDPATPFRGLDKKMTIGTLESMDLRVSTMIARYMEAVYDFDNHRQMVPQNLLYFSCYLLINEIRSIRKVINAKAEKDQDRFRLLNESLGVYGYRFEMCTFDFETSNPWNEALDNKGADFASNKFIINAGRIQETHKLDFLQLASGGAPLNQNAQSIPLPITSPRLSNANPDVMNPKVPDLGGVMTPNGIPLTILDRAKDTLKFVEREILQKGKLLKQKLELRTLGKRALNDLFDMLDARVRGFILGNVFSNLNQFIQDDFYTSTKQFIENILVKKQTVQQAALNAFTDGGPPKIIETKIGELGAVALEYLKLQELQLGNISGFDTNPFQAVENQVILGSLGKVF